VLPLFTHAALDRWEVVEADSVERARFVLQHSPCDILLADGVCTSPPARTAWPGWRGSGRRRPFS
jgi:hypothetical protein